MFRPQNRLPAPQVQPSANAFVFVPLTALPNQGADHLAAQKALYEWALEQARAVVRPSILERDLLGVWN